MPCMMIGILGLSPTPALPAPASRRGEIQADADAIENVVPGNERTITARCGRAAHEADRRCSVNAQTAAEHMESRRLKIPRIPWLHSPAHRGALIVCLFVEVAAVGCTSEADLLHTTLRAGRTEKKVSRQASPSVDPSSGLRGDRRRLVRGRRASMPPTIACARRCMAFWYA